MSKKNLQSLFIVLSALLANFSVLAQSFSYTQSMQNTRGQHSATVLPNGLVLIVGGHNGAWGGNPPSKGNTGGFVSTCELYNPATNSFSYTGSLNTLRYQQTATLLPNGKVLITGGSIGFNTYTNTCEIYDPSTGNWSVTDSMSESRFMHSATLLPNGTVLVIGGLNNSGNIVSTCEIYNPSTNTWSTTGSISNPTWQHSATLLSSGKVLLAGGLHSSGQTNTCQLYNPSTGTWSNTASLQYARTEHHAILLNTGKVLVAAGNNNKSLGSCELYDPNTETWSSTASLNTIRTGCGFIKLPNGKVLIAGGNYWPSGAYVNNYLNSVEVYDPAVGTWSTTANMNTVRYLTVVTLLPNGKAFFTGGLLNASTHQASCEIYTDTCSAPSIPILSSSSSTNCGTQLTTLNIQSGNLYNAASWQWFTSSCGGTSAGTGSSISLYPSTTTTYYVRGQGGCVSSGNCANITITVNSSSPTWTNTTSLNTARYATTAHVLANGKVLIIGGSTNANNNGLKSCELYDPSTTSITAAGSLNYSRYSHASIVLPNGKILVTGGYGGYYHTSCEIYDPATNSWSLTGSMNSQRYAHTITLLNNGKVLITGGHGGSNLSSCEIYDPSTGSWSYTGSLPNPVRGHTATLLSNGKVMVIGGSTTYFGYNITNTCAIYDPSTGVWTATNPMNVSRVWHAATLLNNGKVLVCGGQNSASNYFKSCEIYDPTTNSWSYTGSMKSGRATTTNTVILNNGHILIAGGAKVSGYLDSSEAYNQNTNTWYSLPNLNTARDGLPILLNNGKVLMIGGFNGSAFINNCEIFNPGCASNCLTPSAPTLSATYSNTCAGQSTTLSIASGQLDSATHWQWYSNSCTGTSLGSGNSITVAPTSTTTYFARGEGGCVSSAPCGSITITVKPIPVITPVNDIDLQTPAGVCSYPVSFSAQATGSPSPQIKFYIQDYNSYGPFDYEIHSGDLFSPFYAMGFPTPATINVIASNTCGSDTDQFVITLHGKRVNIACPSNDTLMLDSGETTYTDYTNGHGVFPGTHNLQDASILNHCGFGGGPFYKFSGATVSERFGALHSTPFNVGTTRVLAFAYDEWTGFFLSNELLDENFNDSMLHVWADSCVFYITIVDRQANLISCVNNQTVNENLTGHKFKVTTKSFDPSFTINRSTISSITNNYNNDSTLNGAQFNIGTTRILWTATDTANHYDTCSFLLTVNPCGALTPPGINVYYGNKTISTQSQMDAFYNTSSGSNHNCKYTLLVGSLTLDGSHNSDPITNLCNLSKLTEIIGGLQIINFNRAENPIDLSELSAVTTINYNLNISSNSKLQNATLQSVSYIGYSVYIKDNASLKVINLPALQTIKGDKLLIQNHPNLEKLWISTEASSFAFTGKGSSVDISNNGNSTSKPLSINCKKITSVNGPIVFSNNDNQGVTNFDNIFTGLTALNTKWGKLTITNNDYLNTCCIAASVTVSGSGKRHIISGNTGNCADSMAVFTSCGAFHKRNPICLTFTNQPLLLNLYPNPNQGNFDLQISTPDSGNLTITITDLLGRNMYTSKFAISGDTNLPLNLINAANGQYILKATFNEQVFVKRFIINH